MSTRKFVNFTV